MRPLVLAAGLLVALAAVGMVRAADPELQAAPQDPQFAEIAFRAALNAWGYNEYWRLYGMGTRASRAALSERDFAAQMEQGWRKPGIGAEILDVHIRGVHAVVRAKVRMEYGRTTRGPIANRPLSTAPTDELVQSVLVYEEGEWRVNLYQFIGMARY